MTTGTVIVIAIVVLMIGFIAFFIYKEAKQQSGNTGGGGDPGGGTVSLTTEQTNFLAVMRTVFGGAPDRQTQVEFLRSRKKEWGPWSYEGSKFKVEFDKIVSDYGIS